MRELAKLRHPLACMVVIGIFVVACAQNQNSSQLTPAQQELQQQNARFNRTVAEGAGIGALGGALTGLLIGHDIKSAALGGIAGAAVGAGSGYLVARNNLQHAHTEADLTQAITAAKEDAAAFQKAASASSQIAFDARRRVTQLNADYRAARITASQYRTQIASYQESASLMESQIGKMREESASLRSDAPGVGGSNGMELSVAARQIEQSRQTQERALAELRNTLSEVPAT